jgi:hypothetical protein
LDAFLLLKVIHSRLSEEEMPDEVELPTGCTTSYQQANNKLMEEMEKSRQRFLALMTRSEGRYISLKLSLCLPIPPE